MNTSCNDAGTASGEEDAMDWSRFTFENTITSYTKTTKDISQLRAKSLGEVIIDGGATGTVGGLHQLASNCDSMGIEPHIHEIPKEEDPWHAFGTPGNYSKPERVVGNCHLLIPAGKGRFTGVMIKVIDGDVPIIIGKNSLVHLDAVEAHGRGWIEVNVGKEREKLKTQIDPVDGHAKLVLRTDVRNVNLAEGMLQCCNIDNPEQLINNIHQRTHFHPTTIELLLKRSDKWKPEAAAIIKRIHEKCRRCRATGDPEVMKKFNLNKLHKGFNEQIQMDVAYWKGKMFLNVVDYATGYSEVTRISSRKMDTMIAALERIWIHRHGDCVELIAD